MAFVWGTLGFFALLFEALYRLGPIAWEAMSSPMLAWWHWGSLVLWVAIMAYSEGYRGFQKRFSPRFAARAMLLADSPTLARGLLAPLFCMGLFHATRRVLIVSWGIVVGVVLLIILIRQLDQPWRGIVDAGVVVGLAWGLAASVAWVIQAVRRRPLPSGPDTPPPTFR